MKRRLVGLLAALAMLLVAAKDCPAAGPPQINRGRGKPFFPVIDSTAPWEAGLPVRDFEEVCFQNRSRLGGLTEKEARALLEPAHNQPLALHPIPSDTMRQVEFRGLASGYNDEYPDNRRSRERAARPERAFGRRVSGRTLFRSLQRG